LEKKNQVFRSLTAKQIIPPFSGKSRKERIEE
jgi:hypothetical protein